MRVEQFVMAYRAEQDRLRALLPEGYESLRPVLRINAELRGEGDAAAAYVEFNTPVAACGKRGWLNIAHWEHPAAGAVERSGSTVTFRLPFLTIAFTGVGAVGGCPAEKDNDGCFFIGETTRFVPAETITRNKEYCICRFVWHFTGQDAHGESADIRSVAVQPTAAAVQYEQQPLTPENAAGIPCEQVLGSYTVCFERG
ncbi:MAG: hypothetical protein IJ484_00300 [Oscillospiraceae bacterium]|nr:hypothetical protein [Oscillospiraceae bacterium]